MMIAKWRGKVLIIDDNPDNIDLAEQILEDDYDIVVGNSGQACLDLAVSESPDVILLDVQMPHMDGYETLEKLQKMERVRDIPVIFLSAHYRDVDRMVHGLELGALDYITKPVDDSLLQVKILVAMRIKYAEDLVRKQRYELSIANRDLKSFSYSASHDLRAPLRHIHSYSEALLEDYADDMDEDAKYMLERIAVSSTLMSQLIEGLLNFSRASASTMIKGAVDLSAVAQKELAKLREHEPDRVIDVTIAEGMHDHGDDQMLAVVLHNLLGNAWKYTNKTDQARISFGLADSENPDVYMVKDNGSGFDMKNADKLFKPFSRLHGQEEFEGSGIGLATVHRIIEKHGGKIWAESTKGQGATFFFSLRSER